MERKNIKNFDDIKQRLLQFAECQKIPMGKFFEIIDLKPSNFAGKCAESALKSDNIVKVLNKFPDLNSDWLLLGRGEMLRSLGQNVGNITHGTAVGVNVNGNDISITNNPLVPAMDHLSKSVVTLASSNASLVAENARLAAELTRLLTLLEQKL